MICTKSSLPVFFILGVVISFLISIPIGLFAQGNENIRLEVEEALNSPWGDTAERLAEIGKPAIPLLLEILRGNEFPEYKFPATIVKSLGMIEDRRAILLLLEMLENTEYLVSKSIIVESLARIGDPAAEPAVLSFFEEKQRQSSGWQLEAAYYLLEVGGETSRQKVKEMASYVRDLYERATWTFDEETQSQVFKELRESPFYNEEIVYALLAGLIINLRDIELLTRATKYRQLTDETGPRYKDAFQVLAETDSPETIETIFKVAENSKEMWPPAPPEVTEEEYRQLCQFPPSIRMDAVETLLTISGADLKRITRAFADISVDSLREIPLTIKLQPDKWNSQWRKASDKSEEGEGKISCYLGNIPGGYSARDILPETILLNGRVSPSQKGKSEKIHTEIERYRNGFIGEVLKLKFNKVTAMQSIESVWPGKECHISITGKLSDGKPFKGSYQIKITKPE